MKRITFLLPSIACHPLGGFKVACQYANMLANDGYKVTLVYPTFMPKQSDSRLITSLRFLKSILRYISCLVTNKHSCKSWFNLDNRVKEHLTLSLNECFCPKSDIYIATSIRTAFYLNGYKSNKQKVYLIQGYEAWGGITDEQVISSYKYGFKNIVISKWLQRIVLNSGSQCTLIPNGFDFKYFQKTSDNCDRNKLCVAMLYHTQDLKGCSDGFEALDIVKTKYPELTVNIFGVYPRPNLPEWYHYYQRPDKDTFNKIYNEASIFIGTSWGEGWGLTVGEAMICGCAIACTDIDGYKEMVEDGVTALLSPTKNPKCLADNIIKLIENDSLRFELAKRGCEHIKKFNWEDSYEKFKSVIEQ